MIFTRTARILGPALASLVVFAGGASEAHAWGGLGINDLVMTSTYATFHSCAVDFSHMASSSGDSVACRGSWMFDLSALGLFFATVVVIVRMRLRAEVNRLDLARRYIDQGIEPPVSLFPSAARSDLRRGVILLFAGLGLLATGQVGGNLGPVGMIPGFIGLGYLASYALSQRLSSRSNEKQQ